VKADDQRIFFGYDTAPKDALLKSNQNLQFAYDINSPHLIGGQIDYLCGNLGAAAPLIAGKQVKAIAVLSGGRTPLMPDLATAHEQGLTGFDVTTWTAFFLPKGAPRAIVDKLNEVAHATMDSPAIKARMLEIGVTGVAPERRSPEYLAKFVADEVARWEEPIKSGGLQVH
jgi:tripartite-type tricarboxylate transporter receptor subunit TctC